MEKQKYVPFYKKWKAWFFIIAVIMTLGIIAEIRGSNSSTQATQKLSLSETVVKQIVSSYLKSPGSAQFPELIIKKRNNKENTTYFAFGNVDSKNSFGVLLRSHFFIQIFDKGGDVQNVNNWKIYDLDLGDTSFVSGGKTYDTPLPYSEEYLFEQKKLEDVLLGLK
ncbi:MAG: hypothetical protein NT098_05310 [Candidatus Parcubacteria bacterium]|nr:hypothetical protein [Candidatus Parcubacteria bacterium]